MATYTDATLYNRDVIQCYVSDLDFQAPGRLSTRSVAGTPSNSITMTVNPTSQPSVLAFSDALTICAGRGANFTALPNNAGTTPAYQ